MHRIDGFGATIDRKFTEEITELQIPATDVTAAWLTAVQEEIVAVIEAAGILLDKPSNNQLLAAITDMTASGSPAIVAAETTLSTTHGLIFANPAEGETLLLHLPAYGDVSAAKRYRFKNIGLGLTRIDVADAKTVDDQESIDLNPGDRAEIVKDGNNWQTI